VRDVLEHEVVVVVLEVHAVRLRTRLSVKGFRRVTRQESFFCVLRPWLVASAESVQIHYRRVARSMAYFKTY
jgi:hypothetical protein